MGTIQEGERIPIWTGSDDVSKGRKRKESKKYRRRHKNSPKPSSSLGRINLDTERKESRKSKKKLDSVERKKRIEKRRNFKKRFG